MTTFGAVIAVAHGARTPAIYLDCGTEASLVDYTGRACTTTR